MGDDALTLSITEKIEKHLYMKDVFCRAFYAISGCQIFLYSVQSCSFMHSLPSQRGCEWLLPSSIFSSLSPSPELTPSIPPCVWPVLTLSRRKTHDK